MDGWKTTQLITGPQQLLVKIKPAFIFTFRFFSAGSHVLSGVFDEKELVSWNKIVLDVSVCTPADGAEWAEKPTLNHPLKEDDAEQIRGDKENQANTCYSAAERSTSPCGKQLSDVWQRFIWTSLMRCGFDLCAGARLSPANVWLFMEDVTGITMKDYLEYTHFFTPRRYH